MRAVIEKEVALIMHETSLLMHKYIIVRQTWFDRCTKQRAQWDMPEHKQKIGHQMKLKIKNPQQAVSP